MNKLLVALPVAALLVAPAFAQTQWVELQDNVQVSQFGSIVDQVEDWDLYDSNGQKIGDIEAVLGTDGTSAAALVVDFDDAASLVDGDVIVPIEQFNWEANRLSLTIDQKAAQQLELWND